MISALITFNSSVQIFLCSLIKFGQISWIFFFFLSSKFLLSGYGGGSVLFRTKCQRLQKIILKCKIWKFPNSSSLMGKKWTLHIFISLIQWQTVRMDLGVRQKWVQALTLTVIAGRCWASYSLTLTFFIYVRGINLIVTPSSSYWENYRC